MAWVPLTVKQRCRLKDAREQAAHLTESDILHWMKQTDETKAVWAEESSKEGWVEFGLLYTADHWIKAMEERVANLGKEEE